MKTCLVVDDSRVIRKVARRILEDMRFEIEEAGVGAMLLALLGAPIATVGAWYGGELVERLGRGLEGGIAVGQGVAQVRGGAVDGLTPGRQECAQRSDPLPECPNAALFRKDASGTKAAPTA